MFSASNSNNFATLTKEQIKEKAPSVFGTPSKNVSKHYSHVPTDQVIDDMSKLGWNVNSVQEVKARKNATNSQKHLVVFRNPDVYVAGKDGDDVFPQILMTNSHDGKNAFTFQAGMFRLVCSNGLVIADEQFGSMKIRHMGYDFETLRETIKEMVEKLPLTVESMNKFKQTELDEDAIKAFARKALKLRFNRFNEEAAKKSGKTIDKHYGIDLDDFVRPVRDEDKGNDLWKVFNVVQEKVLTGDFEYVSGAKLRKSRAIKSFKKDLEVNAKLFAIAEEFAA